MKDLKNIYEDCGSFEIITKLRKSWKLQKSIEYFLDNSVTLVNGKNACTYKPKFTDKGVCYFTDYTFVAEERKDGSILSKQTNYSDMWISFVAAHLDPEERDEYLKGLNKFVDRMAEAMKEELLLTNQLKKDLRDERNLTD